MKYRKWGLILTTFCMGLFLSSCSGKTDISRIKPNNKLQGEINLWSDESSLKALQNAEENYKKTQPDVKITISNLGSNDNIIDKISKMNASNSERPDAAVVEEESIPLLMNAYSSEFEDLTKILSDSKDDFTQSSFGGVSYKDKIKAYPWQDYPVAIFYRKDILTKYGVNIDEIKTWDDYIKAGQTISKASSGQIKMLAFNSNSSDMFKILLNQLGGLYRDKNDNCILNGEKPARAMSLIKNFKTNAVINEVSDNNEIINEVKNGTVASVILTWQNVSEITGKMPELKGAFQMNSLPSFDIGGNKAASLGGKALLIFKSTKNDKVVNNFIKYTVSDKDLAVNNLKNNNILSSLTTVYRDSYFEGKSDFFNDEKILKLFSSIDSEAYNIGFTYDFKNLNKNIVDAQKKVLKGSDVNFVMQELVSKGSTN